MKLSSREIKKILYGIFLELVVPWLRDTEYDLPSVSEVQEFLKQSKVNEYHFKDEDFDCDDFALQLHAEVKRNYHWAFGEAFGNKIKGEIYLHNLNLFVSVSKVVYLVEPQTDEIWEAEKHKDNILIVGM